MTTSIPLTAPDDEFELEDDLDILDDDLDEEDLETFDDEDDEDGEIDVVVLDMAGTTIIDDGLVVSAFERAVSRTGLVDDADLKDAIEYVEATMGQSKIEVFRALADDDEDAAQNANGEFERAYAELIAERGAEAVDGAAELIRDLRDAGVFVVLTTGFSPATRDAILASLGWQDLADLVLSPSDAGRGRPHPDMALTAVIRGGARSVENLVVVGDTRSDIESGLRAGAGLVVGVLTGAHSRDELEESGAHIVLDSVADLADLLGLTDD